MPVFSQQYHYKFLLNTNLFLIGQNDEIEVDENSVEVEEFEEIEDEDDEEDDEIAVQHVQREQVVENFVNRTNDVTPPVQVQTVERTPPTHPRDIQSSMQLNHDEFDEKFIKRYCLESGTITRLPLMNVIRKIEYFIQIPSEN